jgi:formylglycine-generating enzyme required for sulfatase activity
MERFKYDVAISFAGEQRHIAEELAHCLKKAGVKVFYDGYEKENLWGQNLYDRLSDIYRNQARYCIILASKEYSEKAWPTHERQNAQARALDEKGSQYILPVKLDDTAIPGILPTVGYLDHRVDGVSGICSAFLARVGRASFPSATLNKSAEPSDKGLGKIADQDWTRFIQAANKLLSAIPRQSTPRRVGAAFLLLAVGLVVLTRYLGGPVAPLTIAKISKDGLKYIWIKPGTFSMGCSMDDNQCSSDEGQKGGHPVTISKGFWMGQTEVTVAAYERFTLATSTEMPGPPSSTPLWKDAQMPIVNVSWDDAMAYCRWVDGRLPTEAEWEYGARGGSGEARYGLLGEIAWYADNSGHELLDSVRIWREQPERYTVLLGENGNSMHDVGQKRPNGFGLFDVLGNVLEWVNDWYDEKFLQNGPTTDPQGPPPTDGGSRLLRGGSWSNGPASIRVSNRSFHFPQATKNAYIGFRCIAELGSP